MGRRKGASRGRKLRPAQATPAALNPCAQTPFVHGLTPKRRGEISELAFALAAARHGFGVSKPFGDSERYDLILDPSQINPPQPHARPRLIRVQVKSSAQMVNGFYYLKASRQVNGRAVTYKLSEIDFIAAYVIPEDSWFIASCSAPKLAAAKPCTTATATRGTSSANPMESNSPEGCAS